MKAYPLDPKRILLIALVSLIGTAAVAGSVYGYAVYQRTVQEKKVFEERAGVLEETVAVLTPNLTREKQTTRDLAEANANLSQSLANEEKRNQDLSTQVQELTGAVSKFQKLNATPPELLKKYSKVYFLNENYIPTQFTSIDKEYLFDMEREQQIYASVWPYITGMLATASSSGHELVVVSAYRSFGEQSGLKSNYAVLYGYGANQFSADQGYSEHQLGTTIDLTSPDMSGLTTQFDATPAYKWLAENAHRYGFILSYPKGNAYYQYEPWHWRFVGIKLATHLHDTNTRFYDMLQSDIDAYLINIFD